MIKNISIKTNILKNITSIEEEKKQNKSILKNVFEPFMNEKNKNNYDYILSIIDNYRYVPKNVCIPEGRYVRFLDTKNQNDMMLHVGGFLTSDNNYSITFLYKDNVYKYNKRNLIIFTYITNSELIRLGIQNIE